MGHTPGPWEAGKAYKQDKNAWFAVVFAPAKTGTLHSPRAAEALGITKKEAEANARLITGVTDLLDICEHILESVENGDAVLEDTEQLTGLMDAIKKAKGED